MPLQSWGHSAYWSGAGGPPPPAEESICTHCWLPPISGGSGDRPPRVRTWRERQVKGLICFWKSLNRYVPERLWVWWVVTIKIFSPSYTASQYAVRKVARDTALRGSAAVQHIVNQSGLYHVLGENIYRNTEASLWTRLVLKERKREERSHRREALVELAYLALKERGR